MLAARMAGYGPPELLVVAEVPDPQPGAGEVTVDVAAAAVNFPDFAVCRTRGADAVIDYTRGDLKNRIKQITGSPSTAPTWPHATRLSCSGTSRRAGCAPTSAPGTG
jgi:NADPH:quinone reductase-like Zn-dependent oxidoreductase